MFNMNEYAQSADYIKGRLHGFSPAYLEEVIKEAESAKDRFSRLLLDFLQRA